MVCKSIRESKNMTQEDIAKYLGVTRSAVAMWETGQSLPRADLLPKLAKILECSIDELFETRNTQAQTNK